MFCPVLLNPACVLGPVTGAASAAAASGVLSGIASAIQSGVAWVVSGTADWWVKVPSPDLAAEPAVARIQQLILPVTAAVATGAMIAAGAKMALTRKANPLVDAGSGLAVIAATSALGVLVPSLLLHAGDAWSDWILQQSTGGQFAAQLNQTLQLTGAPGGVIVVLGIVAIIISVIQGVLMLFRQAALVVLAGVLPLAATGVLLPSTKAWFRRVTGWMLALIFYKPAAAAVYATAFTMIGHGGGPLTALMGFAMVVLSLAALPALMRLFTWTMGAVESSAAGGGFLSAALGGAVAVGAMRGSPGGVGGLAAAQQARMLAAQLGPPGGTPPPGGAAATGGGSGSTGRSTARGHAQAAGASGSRTGSAAASGPSGAGHGSAHRWWRRRRCGHRGRDGHVRGCCRAGGRSGAGRHRCRRRGRTAGGGNDGPACPA